MAIAPLRDPNGVQRPRLVGAEPRLDLRAMEEGPNRAQEDRGPDGGDQIIVRPAGQSARPIRLGDARGGNQQDGQGRRVGGGFQAPTHLKSVQAREVRVEQDEGRPLPLQQD